MPKKKHSEETERHAAKLSTILAIYDLNQKVKDFTFWFSFFVAVVTTLAISLTKDSHSFLYEQLIKMAQFGVSILPNLIGFNLGGYALIIGFGNTKLIGRMLTPMENSKFSLFQKINASFAFCIIIQCFTLIYCFLINLIADISQKLNLLSNNVAKLNAIYDFINFVTFFILLLLLVYSISVIVQIVRYVFQFGQLHHFFLLLEKRQQPEQHENIEE